ncbi:MAG: WYL domain-containing protein [Myroides sp.]
MAKSKHAFTRYKILNNCFSNPVRRFTVDQLVNHVNAALLEQYDLEKGVSKRQIYDDIKFMRSAEGYDAPIESYRDGKCMIYRYSDSDYDFAQNGLTEKDKMQMQEVAEFLEQFKNLEGFQSYSEMATALKSSILESDNQNPAIQFEVNEFLVGKENISALYENIVNKKTLEIVYQPYGKEESALIVSPLFLKQYNNRWFLFSWSHKFESLNIMALDRIKNIKSSNIKYKEMEFSAIDYFDEIIGVTNIPEESIQKVVLKFSANRIPFVKSKPLHGSQVDYKDTEGNKVENTIQLQLKYNRELLSTILSYGADVEVLEPLSLREKVTNELQKFQKIYNIEV